MRNAIKNMDLIFRRLVYIVWFFLFVVGGSCVFAREKAYPATNEREIVDTVVMIAFFYAKDHDKYPNTFEEMEPYFQEYHRELIAPYKHKLVFLGTEHRLGSDAFVMLPADPGIVVGYIRNSPVVEYFPPVSRSEPQRDWGRAGLWSVLIVSFLGNIACIIAYLWRRVVLRKHSTTQNIS